MWNCWIYRKSECGAYAADGLKHGTIALIREGQPVIALRNNEALKKT